MSLSLLNCYEKEAPICYLCEKPIRVASGEAEAVVEAIWTSLITLDGDREWHATENGAEVGSHATVFDWYSNEVMHLECLAEAKSRMAGAPGDNNRSVNHEADNGETGT